MSGRVDSLTQALRDASSAVDEAGIPKDLREIAFARALDYALLPSQPPPEPRPKADGPPDHQHQDGDADAPSLENLVKKLDVPLSQVQRIYEIDDEGVHLLMSTSDLPAKKQDAMAEIAYLIIAGRQATGLDEFTSPKVVKEAADNRGVLDSSNFWKAVGKIDGKGIRIRGTNANRDFKINQAGYEKAAAIVKRIADEGTA
jgi:hypothetical protein